MAGFITNSVELIQRILFDGRKTDELLVLKELVQNADDARAEILEVGISEGLDGADHPLLRGRGLYVVNDGPFTLRHARAVRSLGGSSKVEEDAAIGKFGIGLKSVFYLGEVFFYLCRSADDDGTAQLPLAQVLNPWNNGLDADNPRPEWDTFSPADRSRMREQLNAQGVTDGFVIWVPLRTQASTQLEDGELSVYQAYPGDDDDLDRALFSQWVYGEIARMLPLMRHLRRVQFHAPRGPVTLDAGVSERSQYPEVTGEHAFAGEVQGEGVPNLHFSALEQVLSTGRIRQLRESSHWPRRQVAGASRQVEDKTRAHTAVAFKRQVDPRRDSAGSGQLVIQWAVFLPLGERETIRIGGSTDYHVTLHGCFFITSDRRDILSWKEAPRSLAESSSQLQQQWNGELAQKGTLPLVLPTLAAFAQHLNADETTLLTAGIQASVLWKTNRGDVCQSGHWVKTTARGWQLVPVGTRLLAFPRIHEGQTGRWLPGLDEVQRRVTLFDSGAPNLMTGPTTVWRAEEVSTLLGDLQPGDLDAEQLGQLTSVLQTVADPENWPVRQAWLSRVLALPPKTLNANLDALKALLRTVPPQQRFSLPKGISHQVRQRLALLPTSVLVIPGEVDLEGAASLPWQDALTLLEALSGQRGTTSAMAQIVNAVPEDDRRMLRAAATHLPLIAVRTLNSREDDPTFITPFEAFQRVVDRQLFRATDTTRAWARVVSTALRGAPLEFTDASVIEALGGEISSFEPSDLLGLFRQGRTFTDLSGRVALLEEVIQRNLVESQPDLVRVILHGHIDQLNRREPLLVVRAAQPTLERLAGQLLSGRQEAWRVVPRALDELLNEPQRRLLNVQPLDAAAVADLIDAASVTQVNATAFSESERFELLRSLPLPAARRLPFHPAQSGALVALTAQTVIAGGGRLPDPLAEQVTLLRSDESWEQMWLHLSVERLSPVRAVKRVLDSETPSDHALWLLDQLAAMEADTLNSIREQLTETEWLPDAAGRAALAPGDVLCLPELADAVTRVLAEVDSEYVSPVSLSPKITEHPTFGHLQKEGFLLTGEDAAEALAQVMAEHPKGRYCIGQEHLDFERWWALFGRVPDVTLPALAVLAPLHELNEGWARHIYKALAGPLPDAALAPLLNHLANQHKVRDAAASRDELLSLHAKLLGEVTKRDLWRELRSSLQLRSAKNHWRLAGQLCVQAEGVDPQDLLHPDHQRQLGDAVTPANVPDSGVPNVTASSSLDEGVARAAQDLESYFAAWDGLVPSELIGAFLSLLGGDPAVEGLARRLLHPRSLGTVRDIIESDAAQRPRNVASFAQWVALYRVTVDVSSDSHVWVMSLTDELLRVRRDTSRASVVVGRPEAGRLHGEVFVSAVQLNTLDLTKFSRKELTEALLAATRAVLRGMYFVREDHLDDLWQQLGESDQFDLLYTQDVIVQDSISYIRYQLSLPGRHPLNTLFARWESARLLEAEEHHNRLVRHKGQAAAQIEVLRDELRAAFETEDPDVLPRLLEAVRRRVQDAQYLPASVPFELLQNADDALEELQVMRQGGHVDGTFVIETGPDNLTFMHWGRAINQFALPGFDGELLGFKGDLKKMLMLAASDKGSGDLQVTGKFGMGFKSVYLLTERPRVVSGRLAFDVLGGVYPRQLHADLAGQLRDGLARHGERRTGTAIALEVDAATAGLTLQAFRAWLPVLLVFTRQVKRVVDVTEQGEVVTSWQDLPLGEAGWRIGGVHPRQAVLDRALICQLPSGTLLFPLGAHGLTALAEDVPTLWVTAPTRSYARAGFAVNASFALDIGRAEVASHAPHNRQLAACLGEELAQALRALHDRTDNWAQFVQDLTLAADTTPLAFWQSVWEVLADRAPDPQGAFAGQLVHRMTWGDPDAGLWALLRDRDVLPTGLSGDHAALTSLTRVTHQLSGVAARERLFGRLRESATLNLQYPPGTLVHEDVAARLQALTGGQVQLPKLRLLDVLRAEFGAHPEVAPEHARRLGQEYSRAALSTFGDEQAEVQDYLATFRFQTVEGTFVPAHELILGFDGSVVSADERLRAAFAPKKRVLHPAYQDAAEFVLLCRNGLRADAKALALWTGDARGITAQQAALQYLLEGELASSLADELARNPDTWLRDLLTHPAFKELGHDDRHIVAGRLKLGSQLDQMTRSAAPDLDTHQPVQQVEDPAQALQDLYDHWSESGEELTRRYEATVYPEFMRAGGTLLPFGADRKRWMTLLLLGTYQSLGRTTPQQTRDFLQAAERSGWLDVFTAPEVNPVNWFQILDQFLSRAGGQEYHHWFSRFLATYQLSRHLDDYMAILMGMDQFTSPQRLSAVLNPSSSALFSGSGINVPDLHRALGIGRHFVLRELLRTGTLTTRHMDAEGFYPSGAVRRELVALGCPINMGAWNSSDSRTIHQFLGQHLGDRRATFRGSFDLPFTLQVPVT